MELLILNKNFEAIGIFDTFHSCIWTDRYNSCGDFEIYTPISLQNLQNLQTDFYLWNAQSEHVMIIEDRQIESDIENGSQFTVTGRSLESILERRIIWKQTNLTGNLQNGIQKLLNENVINPSDVGRKIANFVFVPSTDPRITQLVMDAQFDGENLYETIVTICQTFDLGFKVTLSNSNEFVFSLYFGEDRSYEQLTNPYVVFSPSFDNLLSSNYFESKKPHKTATLVAGEGEGNLRKTHVVNPGAETGLDRRELYTDAGDISSKTDTGELTLAQYNALLNQRGLDTLAENVVVNTFEGQAETNKPFVYGKDFFMGDIVQISNEYLMESRVRIVELVQSQDLNGVEIYPLFMSLD